jgi:uncharacterized protein (DUF849 family)
MLREAMEKTWLEVSLNGRLPRGRQPGMPVSASRLIEDGIACVKAGAAIVNVQAFDERSGEPVDDAELYARIIEGIRGKVDAIVYPAAPATGESAQARFAFVERLGGRGLLEWIAVEPGSVNVAHYDGLREDRAGVMQANPEQHVRHALGLARRLNLHPSHSILEPGFIRLGATLHWRESCPAPVYRLTFSSGYTFGFPPEDYGLTALLKLLDQAAPGARWMAAGLDADLLPMIPRVLVEGGHVRAGLGDAPFGCESGNMQLVETAAAAITRSGGQLALARDVRIAIAPEAYETA